VGGPRQEAEDFTPASNVKVPWQCGKCGWGWEASLDSRTSSNRSGCPACAGRVVTPTNNLAVWCGENGRADLLGEWAHPDKAPTDFTPGSDQKVPWKCGDCQHMWDATIVRRRKGEQPTGCPACAGSVVTATNNLAVWCGKNGRDDLLGEWAHPDKAPTDFTPASTAKVPWQCRECGWGWETSIYNRTKSKHPTGCPACNVPGEVARPRDCSLASLRHYCDIGGVVVSVRRHVRA